MSPLRHLIRVEGVLQLPEMGASDWALYPLDGAGTAASEISEAVSAALEGIVKKVVDGATPREATLSEYRKIEQVLVRNCDLGATDTDTRGIVLATLEEFCAERFNADVDLYWDI